MSSEGHSPVAEVSTDGAKRVRRRRLPLSCGDCRKQKVCPVTTALRCVLIHRCSQLSCDRNLPCQRCVKSGRAESCWYETSSGQPVMSKAGSNQPQHYSVPHTIGDENTRLRIENARLRALLAHNREDSAAGAEVVKIPDPRPSAESTTPASIIHSSDHPSNRSPRGYYTQHSLFQYFQEVRCCLSWTSLYGSYPD